MQSGLIGDVTLNKESGGQSETLVSTPAFTQAPDVLLVSAGVLVAVWRNLTNTGYTSKPLTLG